MPTTMFSRWVEPVEKWTYPPYSATIAAGRLWGRGATDNKSGVLAFTKAVERLEQHLVRHGFAHIEVILHAGLPEPPYKISVKEDISQAIIAAATLVFGAPPVINGVSAEGTILKHVWMPTVGCPLLDAHCPDRLCPARL